MKTYEIGVSDKDKVALWTRNIIFGVEDSLVSTVGLLSGIAAAKTPQATIIIAGIVLIVVEAISMAVGSFLSEEYARESVEKKDISFRLPLWGGVVMFFSYFLTGFIPLLPYALFEVPAAFYISIACSLIALFALGSAAAKRVPVNALEHGLKMVLLGGFAITIGVIIGNALRVVF